MSSLLLTDTGARRGRARVSRGSRGVVVPLAEYRAGLASGQGSAADEAEGRADGQVEGDRRVARPGRPAAHRVIDLRDGRAPAEVPAGEPPLRLTRRGRLVVRLVAAAALLVVVGVGVFGDRTAFAGPEPSGTPVLERVVLPGETLWEIAGEVAPEADRRDTVAQIIELNDLPSAGVTAGQRLTVPASTR